MCGCQSVRGCLCVWVSVSVRGCLCVGVCAWVPVSVRWVHARGKADLGKGLRSLASGRYARACVQVCGVVDACDVRCKCGVCMCMSD